MKITLLGGGNMASALIGGMIERGFAAGDIQVVELGDAARAALEGRFGVRAVAGFDAVALACDVLVLAVKPQQMKAALAPLAGQLAGQLVISIAAGQRLADLAGDRLLWGSDWPHTGYFDAARMPDPGKLLRALADFIPDRTLRDQVLTTNPLKLLRVAL